MQSVYNLWGKIKLICKQHPEHEMELTPIRKDIVYKCLAEGCPNSISQYDVENHIIKHIEKQLMEAAMNGEERDLTNHKWTTSKRVECLITKYGKTEIIIQIWDKTEGKR